MSATPVPGSWAVDYSFDERGCPLAYSKATSQLVDELAGGYCRAFALAMHERHGWQLRALGRPADAYSFSPWQGLSNIPRHVYCVRDDGCAVDVRGLFADDAAIRRFCAHQDYHDEPMVSVDLTAADVHELPGRGFPPLGESELAYARQAVASLELDQLGTPLAPRPELTTGDDRPRTATLDEQIEPLGLEH